MNKHFNQFFLLVTLLTACGPAVPPPPPTATATQIIIPSLPPRPTQTAIPTMTPYLSLQTDGPYLLYTDGYNSLTIMDADGIGRKQIELPAGGSLGWYLENTVSPNGKWIAYYTGSKEEPYDLTLHLFNLSDGTSQLISNLFAPGFPENLEPVTKTL